MASALQNLQMPGHPLIHKCGSSPVLGPLGSLNQHCRPTQIQHAKLQSTNCASAGTRFRKQSVRYRKQFVERLNGHLLSTSARRKRALPELRATALSNGSGGAPAASSSSDLVVCFGEMLIDFVPTVGGVSLADAPAFQKAAGGAPANVAVGISRLGGHSAFVGKVGDDEFGHMLASILQENGVETDGVLFDKGARTALAFVTLRADGEREFMFYRNPSADMLLTPEELDLKRITKAGIFHYGSISLITEPCRSAHKAAMKAARDAGVLLSYDPNLRLPLWDSAAAARDGICSIWEEANVIKVSEEEIAFLTEGGDPYSDEAARALFHPNLHLLLVTEGAAGCRYYTPETQGRAEGFKVNAVDTTGAGDAFVAAFLASLSKDGSILKRTSRSLSHTWWKEVYYRAGSYLVYAWEEERLQQTLRFANAAAAITTTKRGAIPALPDTQAVHHLITTTTASAATV